MPTNIIAELSTSHGGERAWQENLVESALLAGADMVKFQSHQVKHLSKADPQYAWMKQCELSDADHVRLIQFCIASGIAFLTTPFHEDRVPFLADLGLSHIKIGSGEAMRPQMLEAVAKHPWTIYLSAGLLTQPELDTCVDILRSHKVVMLHTVSRYPTPYGDANMGRMVWLAHYTGLPCGYSDHTVGPDAALFALGQCAEVVEVHHSLPSAPRFKEWDKDRAELKRICAFRDNVTAMRAVRPMTQDEGERPFVGRWACDGSA